MTILKEIEMLSEADRLHRQADRLFTRATRERRAPVIRAHVQAMHDLRRKAAQLCETVVLGG